MRMMIIIEATNRSRRKAVVDISKLIDKYDDKLAGPCVGIKDELPEFDFESSSEPWGKKMEVSEFFFIICLLNLPCTVCSLKPLL